MGDRTSRFIAALAVCAAGVAMGAQSAAAIPPPIGGLTETQCLSERVGNGCVAAPGIAGARMVAVSPDGKNVYVASGTGGGATGGAVAAFARNPFTGTLTELNCIGAVTGGGCSATASGLSGAWGVAVSPDGATIYVTSPTFGGGSVAAFARDPATGAIGSELDCFDENNVAPCLDGHGLGGASGIAATSSAVYVASPTLTTGGLTSFARGAVTGALGSETACLNFGAGDGCSSDQFARAPIAVAVTPDGRAVHMASASGTGTSYVASYLPDQSGALSVRIGCVNSGSAAVNNCVAGGAGLDEPGDIAVAPDHRVYVAATGAGDLANDTGGIAALSVDATTFGVTGLINCLETDGFGCPQPFQRNLEIAQGVAVSPDGGQLYVAAQGTDEPTNGAVSAYTINAANGAIGSLINCIGEDAGDTCVAGDGIATASFVAVSPDGRNVYLGDGSGGGSNTGGVTTFAREIGPTCTSTTATVPAGATVTIALQCSDANGDPLTRVVGTAPANGVLDPIDQGAGTVVYTASALALGSDSFTFTATDGAATSPPATATIAITQSTTPPLPNQAPQSKITGLHSRVKAKSLTKFTGTASDSDGEVTKVQIAVVQATGGAHVARVAKATKHRRKPHPACRQLSSKGTLSASNAKKGKCAPTVWLTATGTTKWTYKLHKRLPKGRYTIYARATDDAGLKESSFSAAGRNRISFTVT
jgi:DNA-binding beta-propeller fold protein YncE